MRVVIRSLSSLALAATVVGAQKAADPRDALVVSTAWLAQHLEDPNLVVLFLGDDNEYNRSHIRVRTTSRSKTSRTTPRD